ncbi:MAG TPA: hypothetical protein VD906_06225 [Caulobacteraceae bacterium]|nr:hypothetical protein [Caulobacteraceae bacterium]
MHPRNDETRPQQEDGGDPALADVHDAKDRKETDHELDEGLKETFPASDPVSINPGAD